MYSLGVHLSWRHIDEDNRFNWSSHDTAAALVTDDGTIIAAAEEERFTRIKHCNVFPAKSIQSCLSEARLTLGDIDIVAIPLSEETLKRLQLQSYLSNSEETARTPQEYVNNLFLKALKTDISSKLRFVDHHEAHAWSVFPVSGYDTALVVVLDGDGEAKMTPDGLVTMSGLAGIGTRQGIDVIDRFPITQSLGQFYEKWIQIIGYRRFDEYKVMGLAPYGDASAMSDFDKLLVLLPEGRFRIHGLTAATSLFLEGAVGGNRRGEGEPLSQWSKNFAAWLQTSTEKAILHLLTFYAAKTGLKNLCMAGGVVHNCSANGRIYYSGLFDNTYFQPAAHDAGLTVGAAFHALTKATGQIVRRPMTHLFLGSRLPDDPFTELRRWEPLIKIQHSECVELQTAKMIAEGAVVGWVQGRSEFGPRALGARSIVADPRPAENKDRINGMVKKRESYRPFAPSVLAEFASDVFEMSDKTVSGTLGFMISTLRVQPAWRDRLRAVTHIDGTARIHIVGRSENPRYWRLIKAFYDETGVPVLLNTSFNNNIEPIVDNVNDAVSCFLTTEIDRLVVGNYIVDKAIPFTITNCLDSLVVSLPQNRTLVRDATGQHFIDCRSHPWLGQRRAMVSEGMFRLLCRADINRPISELLRESSTNVDEIFPELLVLWQLRAIRIMPWQYLDSRRMRDDEAL